MSVDVSQVPDEVLIPLVALAAVKAKQISDANQKSNTSYALAAAKAADAASDTALAADSAEVLSAAQAADKAIADWVSPPAVVVPVVTPEAPTADPTAA